VKRIKKAKNEEGVRSLSPDTRMSDIECAVLSSFFTRAVCTL
jgi:hypothetical protein